MDEEDERIAAWERVATHPFFEPAYGEEAPLLESMIHLLDGFMAKPKEAATTRAEEPVEWRLLRAFTNGYADGLRRGVEGRLDR